MAARPRMNDGKNESITVYLFIKLGKKDTPPDTTKPHEFSPIDGNFITRYKAFAEANAAAANLTRQSEVKIPYADQYIRYSEINGKYICDTLGILHSFEKHVQTNSNAGDLLARCKAYGATIHDAINTDLNKVKKEATPDYKGEAAEIFRNETADAIGAIKYHTKSKDLSKALQSIRARNSHRAKELYEDKPIRNHLATFTRRLLELQTYTDTPQKHLIEIISKYTSTAKYRRISKQASAEYCMSNKATGEARVLGDKLQKLKDRVSFDGDQIEMTKHKAYELAKDLVPAARETLNLFEFLFNIKTKNKGEIWILSRPQFTAELAKFTETETGAKSETPKNKRLNINGLEIVNSRKQKTVLYNRKKIAENL